MNAADTAIKNEVIRGGVAVEKWDSELDQRVPQGDAGLEGAQIQIISQNPYTVLVGEKEYKKGEGLLLSPQTKMERPAQQRIFCHMEIIS